MAIKSGIFNSIDGDRKYKAEDFAGYFAMFVGNGVFPTPSTGFQVIANGTMTVTLKPGKAWIYGYFCTNDADYGMVIDVADGALKRIDRIVLRLSYLNRTIVPAIKKGTLSSTPVAPALQRDADVYEIALGDILVNNGALTLSQANITDLRLNNSLCGIVHGLIDQVDTTTVFNQYQSWFNTYSTTKATEFDTWSTDQETTFATWRTDQETLFNTWYDSETTDFDAWRAAFESASETWRTGKQAEFQAWFEDVQSQLEGDVATNLQNQITSHSADYVKHPGVVVTTNVGNAYSATLNPSISAYVDGMGLVTRINANSTGAATINIDSLGAKGLKKPDGSDALNLKNNGIYTWRYNGATGNFVLQGEIIVSSTTATANTMASRDANADLSARKFLASVDNGITLGDGGIIKDQSSGTPRTVVLANNDTFDVITENGSSFLLQISGSYARFKGRQLWDSDYIRINNGQLEINDGGTWKPVSGAIDLTSLNPISIESASAVGNGAYQSIASATGKGYIDSAYMVANNNTGGVIPSIRITIDGVVKVLLNASGTTFKHAIGVVNKNDLILSSAQAGYGNSSSTIRYPADGTFTGMAVDNGFAPKIPALFNYPRTDGSDGAILLSDNKIYFKTSFQVEIRHSNSGTFSYAISGAYI